MPHYKEKNDIVEIQNDYNNSIKKLNQLKHAYNLLKSFKVNSWLSEVTGTETTSDMGKL